MEKEVTCTAGPGRVASSRWRYLRAAQLFTSPSLTARPLRFKGICRVAWFYILLCGYACPPFLSVGGINMGLDPLQEEQPACPFFPSLRELLKGFGGESSVGISNSEPVKGPSFSSGRGGHTVAAIHMDCSILPSPASHSWLAGGRERAFIACSMPFQGSSSCRYQ